MISRFEKYRNDLILSKNSTFIRALDKNLFRDYSNNHILLQESMESYNFLINLFMRLDKISTEFGDKTIDKLIEDKLAAGKDRYNPETFRQVISEIDLIGYYLRFFTNFISNVFYEPKLNLGSKKNPEIMFDYEGNTFEIEVKSPTFAEQIIDEDLVVNYKVSDERYKQLQKIEPRPHFPPFYKIKEYLESAQSKFSQNAADRLSNHYGFLVINWEDKNVWFENIDAMFFNNITGIFTNNSFIKDRNDEVKKFDRICGVLFYRRIPTEFGNSNKFIDYRLSERYFIKNPFAKEIDDNIIHQLLIPNKVLKPKNEYDEITEYDLESNPMFLYS